MPKPLLYRPSPRWHVWAALGGALAIHFAAVAIAGIKHEPPVVDVSAVPDAVVVATMEQEPPPPEPTPPPPEPEPPPPPPPEPMNAPEPEFKEEQATPPPVRPKVSKPQPIQPIQRPRPIGVVGPARPNAVAGKAAMTVKPHIDYPYEARRSRVTGSGVVLMTINPANGEVTDVTMAQSTGSPVLDQTCISAFRRARFQPGISKAKTPVTFSLTGASY